MCKITHQCNQTINYHSFCSYMTYYSYTNGIDKALKNFEYSSEWPDLISALGKLSKVIQSNTRFKAIPKSLVVSKRLAQVNKSCSDYHIQDIM